MKIINKILNDPQRYSDYYDLIPVVSREMEDYVRKELVDRMAGAFTHFTNYAIDDPPILAFYAPIFEDQIVDI